MKALTPFLTWVVLFGAGSCSEHIRIRSDYDHDVNFSAYQSYSWLSVKDIETKNDPLIYNELTDKRIKKTVDSQLPLRGLAFQAENPDLRLHYHIVIDSKSTYRPDPYGYYYSPYWIRSHMDVFQYREGTLILDLMDPKNNNLVWRGWASSILEVDEIDLSEQKINAAITKILAEFPPASKK
jgi:Domain of unknown function (DUF4136)